MKIEMGESLMYSWLRHVKECQVVQTNWKPSPKWNMNNKDKILEIMERSNEYLQTRYGYSIYKNNSLGQLIQQAEIDVLGITMNADGEHLYAIDVAFHEYGLNYGSKDETISRVIKKCIRTAMCIYGYMNKDLADIIFASPKINPAIVIELEPKMKELNNLFQVLGLRFNVKLVANEEFNMDILEPILISSGGISDTSELFLRGYQMYSMFSGTGNRLKQPSKTARDIKENMNINSNLMDESLKELKIGQLVQKTMKELFNNEKISRDEIEKMTQKDYSKQVFNSNYPVLKEVPIGGDIEGLKKDENNYSRYYSFTLSIYGKDYLLSSQWYEPQHRKQYEKWLANRVKA